MNSKPNVPNEIWLGKEEYSWWTDWKVNGWLFLATIVSGACDIMFPHIVKGWPVGLRVLITVIPFLAILLWVRNLARWIRGMDEMHSRITLSAILFAVSATFFVVVLWGRLNTAGVFSAASAVGNTSHVSWEISTVGHIFLLMTFFYFLGCRIFHRRYL